MKESESGHDSKEPHSVIFLLHPGQPLSYIANLIRAEGPETDPNAQAPERDEGKNLSSTHKYDPTSDPRITFRTSLHSKKRWSPSTGIGDFLREAARVGRFTIAIGARQVCVIVPSFEARTRFLRASLHAKSAQIERLAHVKDECDRLAHQATQKVAFSGAGLMGAWWVTVGFLTFRELPTSFISTLRFEY